MYQASEKVRKALEETVSYSVFSRVILEAELNGYVDYTFDFPESVDDTLFPADDVFRVRRPAGGLPKSLIDEARVSDVTIDELCYEKDRNWYRVPSPWSNYKYFRSEERAFAFDGEDVAVFDSGPLIFEVEYESTISCNNIVLGFEAANGVPGLVEIEVLRGGQWQAIGDYEVPESGLLRVHFDEQWSGTESYSYSFDRIDGIRFSVLFMTTSGAAVELIQVSPRLSIDISDRIINVSVSKSSQESSLSSPAGASSSDSATLSIANDDGFFDFLNQNSPLAGLTDVNVAFYVSDVIDEDRVPQGIFYANSWDYDSTGTVSIDCSDFSKFLQAQSIENCFYMDQDIRFVIADILERSGIVKYRVCFAQADIDNSSPFYYFNDDQSVWEALQQIATAEQAFFYFDGDGRFVWNSRDFWWASEEIDYEIISRAEGNKLANLQSYGQSFSIVANKATVKYFPTDLLVVRPDKVQQLITEFGITPLYARDERVLNNVLWRLDRPTALISSQIGNEIDENSEYILVNPVVIDVLPEEGIMLIDSEYIRFSKKPRIVGPINKQRIEDIISDRIDQISIAIQDAAQRKSVSQNDVRIVFAENVLWPNSALGCPDREIEDETPVQGFFVILRADDFFLQYNASDNGVPFLCAIADLTEEKENISYWTYIDEALDFVEGEGGIQVENALFVEKRGEFNSDIKNHSTLPVPGGSAYTFIGSPPSVIEPQNRLFATESFENSRLKIRTNRYDFQTVHHYSPNSDGKYDIYGTQLFFPETDIKDAVGRVVGREYLSQGIAGMFVNQTTPGTGYYIELVSEEFARFTRSPIQNVRIWKYDEIQFFPFPDGEDGEDPEPETRTIIRLLAGYLPENFLTLSLDDIIAVAGVPLPVISDTNYNLNVYVKEKFYDLESIIFSGEGDIEIDTGLIRIGEDIFLAPEQFEVEGGEGEDNLIRGVEITVYVDGRRIFRTVDYEVGDNQVYTEGKWGVFARGSTDVDFEYIYAINRLGDRSELSKAQFAIRDQIRGGFIDNTLEHFTSLFNNGRNIYFFDDFGAWARQVIEFDVQNEITPAIFSSLFISNESAVFKVYEDLDQFSSRFALGTRLRGNPELGEIVLLSGDDANLGSSMTTFVSGPPVNRSEEEIVTRVNEKAAWRRGEEEVFVESVWIQTKAQAERIADWIVQRWSEPAEVIDAQIALDPRLEVGDLVSLSVPENSIFPESNLYHITNIEKTVGDSPAMSVTLRRARF